MFGDTAYLVIAAVMLKIVLLFQKDVAMKLC